MNARIRTTPPNPVPPHMVRHVIFEVVLHDEKTPWAEWDVFWNDDDHPNEDAGVITRGTAPSLEAAIDKALEGYTEWKESQR